MIVTGYSRVASWNLPGKARDDVIGQGAEQVRPLLRGRLAGVPWPEQYDLISRLDRQVARVDHALVHADRPRDRQPAAPDEDWGSVRARARNAFVVSERDKPEPGCRRRHVPVA